VIEVDGEIHDFQADYDRGRTAELEKYGLKVVRFSNADIFENLTNVMEIIRLNI
jgi:very-short-patch-repair endonuclease